ncbi:ATP-binding protein [Erythrobacter sp.]|uniref:ATP-binding protein n=1 Tax=Erythrobacter sp. TaxID=1042 RepID=UPI003C72C62E
MISKPEPGTVSRYRGSPIASRVSLDRRSVLIALLGGIGFFALGLGCLSLSRFDLTLASLWIPNAAAVGLLLSARPARSWPLFAAIVLASFGANVMSGNTIVQGLFYTLANGIDIALVTCLTRRTCGRVPDMTDARHVARFTVIGGFVGPFLSAMFAMPAMDGNAHATLVGASSWFLADSFGMILTVPPILLLRQAMAGDTKYDRKRIATKAAIILVNLAIVLMVFLQPAYPPLLLIPTLTLLVAFAIGPIGTALHVPGLALIASWASNAGVGPIAAVADAGIGAMYLIVFFVLANFLSGLPIAAILEGRSRIAEDLVRGRRELTLLADNITDAVLKYDLDGVCTYASPSVRTVLGRPPEAFIGLKASENLHPDACEAVGEVERSMLEGETENVRLTYRRLLDGPLGDPVFIEADCATAFNHDTGERNGFVVSARNVTERVVLNRELVDERRKAEQAGRAKSHFLANMSHEIRTPMNGVLGFAELLLHDDLKPEHRRNAEMIVRSGRSMMMLLNDILDLSKIEAGRVAIDMAPVDLVDMISECTALKQPLAREKDLDLVAARCDPPEGSTPAIASDRPFVVTDGLRLRQILLNLVGNAVKFTDSGGIEVRYWAAAEEFVIEVRDTGMGIDAARVAAIFDPFTQAEGDISRRFGGSGLGLAISRQLAQLLGGSITVESEPGQGSCFRLSLPAIYVDGAEYELGEPETPEPAALPQSSRILLAEDHDVNRMLALEMLERCGQSVAVAHDGNEAIAMVMESMMRGEPFDLVLMDLQMPGCDGLAATRAIREEGISSARLPIVALTANVFPEDIADARKAGMQAHLPKPLVFSDLARTLQRWLPTKIVETEAAKATSTGDPVRVPNPPVPDKRADTVLGKDDEGAVPSPEGRGENLARALQERWTARRAEALAKVREILEDGTLEGCESEGCDRCDEIARFAHKLAGTAASFGEPELGRQATVVEKAFRDRAAAHVREKAAFNLLTIADNPVERRASERNGDRTGERR